MSMASEDADRMASNDDAENYVDGPPDAIAPQGDCLLLVDLSAVFFWKWHASAGEHVDAAFEYSTGKVVSLADGFDASRVVVCCDSGKSFRHDIDPPRDGHAGYKGNRPPRDETAIAQLRRVERWLREHGYHVLSVKGFEADDIIATLVAWAGRVAPPMPVLIAGSDKDLLQLVNDDRAVKMLSITSEVVLSEAEVRDKFGVGPEQMRDYLALVGDASDNVKGVPKVGAKTATKLLSTYRDAAGIWRALDWLDDAGKPVIQPESVRLALTNNVDVFALAQRLVSLRYDVPIDFGALLKPAPVVEPESPPVDVDGPPEDALIADETNLLAQERAQACHSGAAIVVADACRDCGGTGWVEQLPGDAPVPCHSHSTAEPAHERQPAAHAAIAAEDPQPMTTTAPTHTNGTAHAPTPAAAPVGRFSAANVTTAPDVSAHKFILTGRSGAGKTFFASTIPGVFILPIEEGLKGASPEHTPAHFKATPRNLVELHEALDGFVGLNAKADDGKRPHQHLVLDSLTGIETLVHGSVTDVEKVTHMEAKEYKKLWRAAEPVWVRVQRKLDAIRHTGVHVWLIAHSAEQIDASSTTGDVYRKWDLLLKGTGDVGVEMRNMWRAWADHVFFIDWVVKVAKGDRSKRSVGKYEGRILYTRESATHYAKTRSRLPPSLPATWDDLRDAIAAGRVAPEAKLRAQVSDAIMQLVDATDRNAMIEALKASSPQHLPALLNRVQGLLAIASEDAPDAVDDLEQAPIAAAS